MEKLRDLYLCWKKRREGKLGEDDLVFDAEEFDQLLDAALASCDRSFFRRLIKVFQNNSKRPKAREAALRACLELYQSNPTWPQIQDRAEARLGFKPKNWRRIRREIFF